MNVTTNATYFRSQGGAANNIITNDPDQSPLLHKQNALQLIASFAMTFNYKRALMLQTS
jgi:hypothetical protein